MSARDIIALGVGVALCWLADMLDRRFRMTQVEWDLLLVRLRDRRS